MSGKQIVTQAGCTPIYGVLVWAFDQRSNLGKMITDGLYDCNKLNYRLRNQLREDFGIFSCQYLWSTLVSQQEQWSFLRWWIYLEFSYTRVYSVNLMCTIASIKCCYEDTFPNKDQSYRLLTFFCTAWWSAHPQSQHSARSASWRYSGCDFLLSG